LDEIETVRLERNPNYRAAADLWIVTDGTQPVGNNGCFVCALDGPMRGAVRQFMEGPVGAEICGCEFLCVNIFINESLIPGLS